MRPQVTLPEFGTQRRFVLSAALASLATGAIFGSGVPTFAQTAAPVTRMSPDEAYAAAAAGDIFLVDIRRPEEWQQTGVAEGAIGLDMTRDNFVPSLVTLRRAAPDKPIAVICRTGNRSDYVTKALAAQGFPGLVDVSEGMVGGRNGPGWLKRGLPVYVGSQANVASRRSAILP